LVRSVKPELYVRTPVDKGLQEAFLAIRSSFLGDLDKVNEVAIDHGAGFVGVAFAPCRLGNGYKVLVYYTSEVTQVMVGKECIGLGQAIDFLYKAYTEYINPPIEPKYLAELIKMLAEKVAKLYTESLKA